MGLHRTALVAFAVIFTASLALAGIVLPRRILTVSADGTAQFTTIQAAINAARISLGQLTSYEIVVGPGVYTGTGSAVVDLQRKPILLRSSSGPENTIINGQGVRVGISAITSIGGSATIRGFTIRNCSGIEVENSEGGFDSFGGGMSIINTSPIIADCIFRNNSASYGGGIHCASFNDVVSRPTLQNCIFENNRALRYGGGFRAHDSLPEFINCTFTGNYVTLAEQSGGGGGMQNVWSSIICTDCVFIQNRAPFGGGVFNVESNPRFTGCEFRYNVASGAEWDLTGGAMFNQGIEANHQDSIPHIEQSTFCENQPDTLIPVDSWRNLGGNQFEELCDLETPEGVGPFLRGNTNGDARIDISDSISILRFLFIGDQAISCMAATDSNGDGNIDITDAIYSLSFLFLGGEAFPSPTECGNSELGNDIALGCKNDSCN